jgi:hypothetical protein
MLRRMPATAKRLALVVLFAFGASSAASASSAVAVNQLVTSCDPGTDEFAVNCTAEARAGGFVFQVRTGDSQLFVFVKLPGCQPPETPDEQSNWWRDELVGLDAPRRNTVIREALARAVKMIAKRCGVSPAPEFSFERIPDIAVASNSSQPGLPP